MAILACDFFTADLLDSTQAYGLAVMEHATRRVRILGTTARRIGARGPGNRAGSVLDADQRVAAGANPAGVAGEALLDGGMQILNAALG